MSVLVGFVVLVITLRFRLLSRWLVVDSWRHRQQRQLSPTGYWGFYVDQSLHIHTFRSVEHLRHFPLLRSSSSSNRDIFVYSPYPPLSSPSVLGPSATLPSSSLLWLVSNFVLIKPSLCDSDHSEIIPVVLTLSAHHCLPCLISNQLKSKLPDPSLQPCQNELSLPQSSISH